MNLWGALIGALIGICICIIVGSFIYLTRDFWLGIIGFTNLPVFGLGVE